MPACKLKESSHFYKIGTHCVHVGIAVHTLQTCLFTDTHSLTHSYMPDDIVDRALYSANYWNLLKETPLVAE